MRKLALSALTTLSILSLAAGCGDSAGNSSSASASSGDVGAGQSLYSSNCAGCHGTNAEGGVGPALAGVSDSNAVIDTILNGTENMPGFASSLSDADISDILAFLGSL